MTRNQLPEGVGKKIVEALKRQADVTVVSDSKYVCDAFNQKWIDGWIKKNWKNVKNVELWQRLLKAINGHSVVFNWVKGHAGHPYNERCDKMAVYAYKNSNLFSTGPPTLFLKDPPESTTLYSDNLS